MNKQHFLWAALCCLMLVGVYSCRKDYEHQQYAGEKQTIENMFFNTSQAKLSQQKHAVIERVKKLLILKEKEKPFIKQLCTEIGFADWEHTWFSIIEKDTVLQIPLVMDGKAQTSGIFVCVLSANQLKTMTLKRNCFEYGRDFVNKTGLTVAYLQELFTFFDFMQFGKSSYQPDYVLDDKGSKGMLRYTEYWYECAEYRTRITTTSGAFLGDRLDRIVCTVVSKNACVEHEGGSGTIGDGKELPKGGGSSTPKPAKPAAPEIKDSQAFEQSRAKCVRDNLETIDGGIINKIRKIFGHANSRINLTYDIADINKVNPSKQAMFSYFNNDLKNVKITLDDEYSGLPDIYVAQIFIHEAFHAYIHDILYGDNADKVPVGDFKTELAECDRIYGEKQGEHNYMANMYKRVMTEELTKFINRYTPKDILDKYTGHAGWGENSEVFAEMLMWTGLTKTEAFQENEKTQDYQKKLGYYNNFLDLYKPEQNLPKIECK